MSRILAFWFFICLLACAGYGSANAAANSVASQKIDERPWPRQYTVNGKDFSVYRPELDSWINNQLLCRVVMAVRTTRVSDDTGYSVDAFRYGVVWLKARTETDTQGRVVALTDVTVTKVSFPTGRDQEAQYQSMLQSVTAGKSFSVSLDQLEAGMAVAGSRKTQTLRVNHAPPEIIFSLVPSVLVHVDGQPVWRASGVAGVDRAVNTKALLLRYQGRFYLGYAGHWAMSAAISRGWAAASAVPPPLLQLLLAAEATNQAPARADLPPNLARNFGRGKFPAVYLRTRPAELISIHGSPEFASLGAGGLSYVSNTAADVIVDGSADRNWYVLVSGRWFSAPSSKGPWRHVAANALPRDFQGIPEDSPKGALLASIAGTPQAREAVIANMVAQTAKVDRSALSFQTRYDGAPRFRPLAGTRNLSFAVNSPIPVINVPGHSYYALDNGVWFVSEASPEGPWVVATSVPAEIYAIPSSSPLHYVSYVRVYGTSGRYAYVGYTPGYYGTIVSNDVVVYGTGYACTSWIGANWYGCPETYGYGAALAYGTAIGWGVTFGWGWDYPWYNPWSGPWSGSYPGYYPWAYGGAAAWNVYGRWGNGVVAGTRARWANPWSGNHGRPGPGAFYNPYTGSRGYGYAGRNRKGDTGRAAGLHYNPQTGRVTTGQGPATAIVAKDEADTGASRSPVTGNAQGAGYARVSGRSGEVGQGRADINGGLYAGSDGNIYRNIGESWEKMGPDGRFAPSQPAAGLESERVARLRAGERDGAVYNFQLHGGFNAGGGRYASPAASGGMRRDGRSRGAGEKAK